MTLELKPLNSTTNHYDIRIHVVQRNLSKIVVEGHILPSDRHATRPERECLSLIDSRVVINTLVELVLMHHFHLVCLSQTHQNTKAQLLSHLAAARFNMCDERKGPAALIKMSVLVMWMLCVCVCVVRCSIKTHQKSFLAATYLPPSSFAQTHFLPVISSSALCPPLLFSCALILSVILRVRARHLSSGVLIKVQGNARVLSQCLSHMSHGGRNQEK